MSRTILDGTSIYDSVTMQGLNWKTARQTIGADFQLPNDGPPTYVFAMAANRNILLPPITGYVGASPIEGRVHMIVNSPASVGSMTIKLNAADGGATLTAAIPPGSAVMLVVAGGVWTPIQAAFDLIPPAQFATDSQAGAATMAVGDITGAATCNLLITAVGAANLTTRTAVQMFADIPGCFVGFSWQIIIKNTNAGTTTIVGGVGVTVTGTATIAQNTGRIFNATFTANNALTLQSMGTTAGI